MNVQLFMRWTGLAAIISSVLAILLTIPTESLQFRWLHILQHILMILGLSGVYSYQYRDVGKIGRAGFILAILGSITFLGPNQILGIESLTLGGIGSGLGLILLSIGSLRAQKFPRWMPGFWLAGAIIGVPATYFISYEGYLLLISAFLFAIGFVGAGLQLMTHP